MKNKRKRAENPVEDGHDADKQKRRHKRQLDDDFDEWESWDDDGDDFRSSYASDY